MKLHPACGTLLVSLLLTGCSAPANPPTEAQDPKASPLLTDARMLATNTWEAVEDTTAQLVSLINQGMTAGHQAVERLFHR